jgi:hypothetical protein
MVWLVNNLPNMSALLLKLHLLITFTGKILPIYQQELGKR